MKLYHGTTYSASLKIEEDKALLHEITRPHYKGEGLETTDGYVYLTNNVGYAAYLAQRLASGVNDFCVVYEIDLADNELEADVDQLKIIGRINESAAKALNAQESLNMVQSCCVPRTLVIGKDVISKMTLPSASNSDHEDYGLLRELRSLRHVGKAEKAETLIPQQMWKKIR